jgi:hypothetical protein
MRCHWLLVNQLLDKLRIKMKGFDSSGKIITKGEPITPRADLSA